jgi:hypothetical protein
VLLTPDVVEVEHKPLVELQMELLVQSTPVVIRQPPTQVVEAVAAGGVAVAAELAVAAAEVQAM